MVEVGISMVPAHSILGLVNNSRSDRKLRSALEYPPMPAKSPSVCLARGLFHNVHKIRVDSDNKR